LPKKTLFDAHSRLYLLPYSVLSEHSGDKKRNISHETEFIFFYQVGPDSWCRSSGRRERCDRRPKACSYDPVSGNFIENGVESNFGSWEHARQCARDGRLPEIVLKRLGAFGEEETRAEAAKLKAQNRRVALLRRSKQEKKISATDALTRPSQMSRADNQAVVRSHHQSRFSEPPQRAAIPQTITSKKVGMTSTDPDVVEAHASMGKNAEPETVGLKKIIDPDPNRRTAVEFGADDENSTDWMK
jgi:hypothetical protein